MEFFEGMTSWQQVYWGFALVGSAVFAIQVLMTFIGMDGVSDLDTEMDAGFGDFQMFSLKAVVAFITFFGWGGVLIKTENQYISLAIALACGITMMVITAALLYYLMKLQHEGSEITTEDYLNRTANVYLSIPKCREGKGKITVNLDKCTREVYAMADEEISSGTPVKIIESIDKKTFIVEKI